jgi:hypothetical protein
MVDYASQTEEDAQKYREALNNSNPTVRAERIQHLVSYNAPLPADKSHPSVATDIEKALADKDPTVREAACAPWIYGMGMFPASA